MQYQVTLFKNPDDMRAGYPYLYGVATTRCDMYNLVVGYREYSLKAQRDAVISVKSIETDEEIDIYMDDDVSDMYEGIDITQIVPDEYYDAGYDETDDYAVDDRADFDIDNEVNNE